MDRTEGNRLVGRRGELEILRDVRARACAGDGAAAVVLGEPGIGKSALLNAATAATPGPRILRARGAEIEAGYPFGLIRQLVEPVLLGLDEPARERLFAGPAAPAADVFAPSRAPSAPRPDLEPATLGGLYWLLAAVARERPLVLSLDDLQWADPPSLPGSTLLRAGRSGSSFTTVNRRRRLRTGGIASVCAVLVAVFTSAPVASAAPLSIAVDGNHFVNGAGQTIRLLGVNHTSSEYACVDGFGYNDGHQDAADAAAIASWGANAVRVPLNEDCWLGINGQPNNSEAPGENLTAAGYRQAVESYVADLGAQGLYAILDLHWTAPGSWPALEQQPMPDLSHSPAFWTSVAGAFKSDPGVVFDVFNEPYDPTDPRSGSDANQSDKVTWECWENGTKKNSIGGGAPPEPCLTSAYDENGNPTTSYQIAGMQTLVDAIRATGATQPVMVGGLDYANDLSGWLEHAPVDPLNQEVASFHNYMGEECDNVGCWEREIAPVAARVPVVTGEFAEDNFESPTCGVKTPNTFDEDYMNWADGHGVSYLAWGWVAETQSEIEAEGCSAFYLIDDYESYAPASPNGTVVRSHLLALKAAAGSGGGGAAGGGPTPAPPAAGGATKPGAISVLRFATKARTNGKTVSFTVAAGQACSGSIAGLSSKPIAVAGKKPKKLVLGSVAFKLDAGKAKSVVLKLSGPAQELLAAKGSLTARFTLTLSAKDGRTVLHRTVGLKEPKGHRGSS